MKTYCGANCDKCGFKEKCKGCVETNGSPFGGKCIAAEYIKAGGIENYTTFKKQLIDEFNTLGIDGMPEITQLHELAGFYVNLEYPLPNGEKVKLLRDNDIYLGNQVKCKFSDGTSGRCFGLIAGMDFLLVCEYGESGTEPEIVVFKRR